MLGSIQGTPNKAPISLEKSSEDTFKVVASDHTFTHSTSPKGIGALFEQFSNEISRSRTGQKPSTVVEKKKFTYKTGSEALIDRLFRNVVRLDVIIGGKKQSIYVPKEQVQENLLSEKKEESAGKKQKKEKLGTQFATSLKKDIAEKAYSRGCELYESGLRLGDKEAKEKFKKAFDLFTIAAEYGNSAAQYFLGLFYFNGYGMEGKNEKKAVEWYEKAANQGDPVAQYDLGVCYFNGTGVERKDEKKAVEWYEKAAKQGYALAQYNLGLCYKNGTGVEKNDAEAVGWFKLAANQGYAFAQYNLGLCYLYGTGVERSRVEAVKWFNLSAEKGDGMAKTMLKELTKSVSGNSYTAF